MIIFYSFWILTEVLGCTPLIKLMFCNVQFSICTTKVCSQSVVLSTLSLCEGDNDMVEKPVDPVRVYSERELTKEFEKVAGMLTAEQDWSIRMAAMQRVEGLVFGGATEYACFPLLLKQLVGPLSLQLADRRSSIVKQVTSLLCQGWARKWLEDLLVLPNSTTFNSSSFRLCSCNQLNQWIPHGEKSDSWPSPLAEQSLNCQRRVHVHVF
jgi:hypothetical protein